MIGIQLSLHRKQKQKLEHDKTFEDESSVSSAPPDFSWLEG